MVKKEKNKLNLDPSYIFHVKIKIILLICVFVVGDFASAIETLVTAISLIKQSKIANDDRCKILISSLQDTLHGIEEKSYGSK